VIIGAEVVQREQLDRVGSACFEDLRDAGMKLPPSSVRKALVGRIPDERVSEPEGSRDVGVAFDELAESIPRLGGRSDERVVFENLGDDRSGERHAEDRRPAQERAVSGAELIDSGSDEALDRLGQLLGRIRLLADAGELAKEERVPCGTFHERRDFVICETPIARGGDRERACVVFGERIET
jgi:hypothetical protein